MGAVTSSTVEVDDDVTGQLWNVNDTKSLAQLIAVIALGQAQHAVRIIEELEPLAPALTAAELFRGAPGANVYQRDDRGTERYIALPSRWLSV